MSDLLERPAAPKVMKAPDVRAALRRHFPAPECAIAFEVAHSTGTQAHRHLDAVAMDLWPSRGLSLHGIEIKVNLYDWRREKANPSKAEQIARFCDYFWIAAPAGVVPVGELPPAWGMIVVDGAGKTAVAKRAEKTPAEPVGRPFLAAMLRAAGRPLDQDEVDAVFQARRQVQDKQFEERVRQAVENRREGDTLAAQHWRGLVEAIGEQPDHFWRDAALIDAVQVVMKAGVAGSYGGLRQLHEQLRAMHDRVAEAIGELAIPEPAAAPDLPKARRSSK
jgi:hypothetical protein